MPNSVFIGGLNGVTVPPQFGGNILFNPDATYDIGATGASRPRDIFASRTVNIQRDAIGDTSTDGLTLVNSTAAAAGAQQHSPRIRLRGNGWKTNATAASQTVDYVIELVPIQGAAAPTAEIQFRRSINGGAYQSDVTFTDGLVSASAFLAASQVNIAGGGSFRSNSNGTKIMMPSDGVITLFNNASNDFNRLQFGGTSSSFPSLKRSTTTLQVRLADDSNYGAFAASAYSAGATAGVTAGPFTTITSIQTIGGIVTALTGSA